MDATIVINTKTYTIIKREDIGYGAERVTLETKSGTRKTALFFNGEFDVWETKPRHTNKFSRVNMRS